MPDVFYQTIGYFSRRQEEASQETPGQTAKSVAMRVSRLGAAGNGWLIIATVTSGLRFATAALVYDERVPSRVRTFRHSCAVGGSSGGSLWIRCAWR